MPATFTGQNQLGGFNPLPASPVPQAGDQAQPIPLQPPNWPAGQWNANPFQGSANDYLFQPQINRNESLANQELAQYESGVLMPGDKAAIDLADQEMRNQLTQEFAGMGRTGPDTTFGQGEALISQQTSIATRQALDKYLQNYYKTSEIEAGLTQAKSAADLAVLDSWMKYNLGEQQLQQEQQQQQDQLLTGLFGGIGKLFGGAFGGGGAGTAALAGLGKLFGGGGAGTAALAVLGL